MIDRLTDADASQGSPSPISLLIPCRAEYVALCRLVAGALGTRDGLDEELVADIKVIVTEACNCFLAAAGVAASSADTPSHDCSIRVEFDSRPDEFVISMVYPEKRGLISWLEGCDPMGEAGLGLTILKALTDQMVEVPDEGGTTLRLTKRLAA